MSEREIIDRLNELIFWTRFSAMPTFRASLLENLRTDVDKLVYELSDGNRSTREIASMISRGGRSVTHVTVSNMWRKWAILNLVMLAERRGRYRRIYPLESMGIEVPSLEMIAEERGE